MERERRERDEIGREIDEREERWRSRKRERER